MSWDETGYGAPETQHAPVVHSMSHSMFNGVLNVFIYGSDGYIHHISQTTCDKVPNPWGWCTWSVWYKISDKIPETLPSNNPLSTGANIHLGIEVFMCKILCIKLCTWESPFRCHAATLKWIVNVLSQSLAHSHRLYSCFIINTERQMAYANDRLFLTPSLD